MEVISGLQPTHVRSNPSVDGGSTCKENESFDAEGNDLPDKYS